MGLFDNFKMGLVDNLFGNNNQQDPMQYLNQIPQQTGQYLNPYIQEGRQAGTAAQGQYSQMAQNPMNFLNQIMQGYQPSQGYQYKSDVLGKDLANTAASGGFRGTNEDQRQRAELINSLMGQDMQQYLQNVLGIQGTGLQGQELGAGRGFQASGDMANILGTNLSQQAGLRMNQNNQSIADRGNIMKLIASLAGTAGGFMLGGPAGAAAGSNLGSIFGGSGNSRQSGVTGSFGSGPYGLGGYGFGGGLR